jgi:protein TonB
MSDQPPFLAALELEPGTDPDERALRRAYARRLKQIDVEAEPARFQALREALDQGLRWVAWRHQQRLVQATEPEPAAAPASAPEPDPLPELAPRPAPTIARPADAVQPADAPRVVPDAGRRIDVPSAPSAEAHADAALARFQRHVDDGLKDAESTRSLLLRVLGDPDLASLDGRAAFELGIARMLGGPWRPGHEHVLDPAIEVFGWNSDHARLKHFGQLGAMLTAAIRERATVQAFDAAQRLALDALLARLRGGAAPDPERLVEEVPRLQYLVQNVPNWLRIVSPVEPVNERFKLWSDAPPEEPHVAGPPSRRTARRSASLPGAMVAAGVAVLLVIIGALGGVSSSHQAGQAAPWRADGADIAPRRETSPADDADLARRQKEAEALLARVRQPGGVAR